MPRTSKSMIDGEILAAALEGLELQRQRIDEQIAQIRALLGRRRGRPPGKVAAKEAAPKRRLSAAGSGNENLEGMKQDMGQKGELLFSLKQIPRLLTLEKARRGVGKHELVFVGTANIAEYSWCGMKAVLKSRAEEARFFPTYLEDRLKYSLELGRIQRPPKKQADLLRVGDDITHKDIERLLKSPSRQSVVSAPRFVWIEEDGVPTGTETALLSPEDWDALHEEKDPLMRGVQLEAAKAERYPTIRWNFAWDKYVIEGIPDGITDSFVYEFKTTRNLGLLHYIKPVAHNQADLYGLFFNRDEKKVQVYVTGERKTHTWHQKVDRNRAKVLLEKFRRVDQGELPLAPRQWKCKKCEFRSSCPLISSLGQR